MAESKAKINKLQYVIGDPKIDIKKLKIKTENLIGMEQFLSADNGSVNQSPFFSFDQDFFNKMSSITKEEYMQSVPYIRLCSLNFAGEELENFNLQFFQSNKIDESALASQRFGDRPFMSLKDIELKTSQASGYLFYVEINLKLKIHKPSHLLSVKETRMLESLLIPNCPHSLEYGWNSPNKFMDKKTKLYFAITTYNLSMDQTGQIDLTINASAFNKRFGSMTIQPTQDILNKSKEFIQSVKENKAIQAHIKASTESIKNQTLKLETAKEASRVTIEKNIDKAKGELERNFAKLIDNMKSAGIVQNDKEIKWKDKKSGEWKSTKIDYVSLHDLLNYMCGESFTNFKELIPQAETFNIVYGNFNKTILDATNDFSCIADYPIDLKKFKEEIKSFVVSEGQVPTIQWMINTLCSNSLNDEKFIRRFMKEQEKGQPEVEYQDPHLVFSLQNDGKNYYLLITDIKANVTPSLSTFRKDTKQKDEDGNPIYAPMTESEVRSKIKELEISIPFIPIGHGHTFVKTFNLTSLMDDSMKSVLIKRMSQNRLIGERINDSSLKDAPPTKNDSPLTLPLKGTATVIGHPAWLPFKAFYLDYGIHLVNGIYIIQSVSHKLGPGEFTTSIEFIYH